MPREALHFRQFCGTARAAIAAVLGQHGTGTAAGGAAPVPPVAHPPDLRSGGGSRVSRSACRRRCARAIMRARMRSPVCIVSRSASVCCGDVSLRVFLPAVPGLRLLDFRLLPEGRSGLFLPVSFRISSRCACVMGSPCRAGVRVSGSCRSPRIGLGLRRRRRRRNRVWPTGRREKTTCGRYQP